MKKSEMAIAKALEYFIYIILCYFLFKATCFVYMLLEHKIYKALSSFITAIIIYNILIDKNDDIIKNKEDCPFYYLKYCKDCPHIFTFSFLKDECDNSTCLSRCEFFHIYVDPHESPQYNKTFGSTDDIFISERIKNYKSKINHSQSLWSPSKLIKKLVKFIFYAFTTWGIYILLYFTLTKVIISICLVMLFSRFSTVIIN